MIGYNANNFCITPSNALFFTTGQFPVATTDPQASLIYVNAYSSQANQLVLEVNIDRQSSGLLEIFNLEGKRITSERLELESGSNTSTIYLESKGVYLYRLSTPDRVLSGKTLVH
ncbi:MAG: T9SS type A sorting domain-containing protein [Saprospiraceae bacterium]|nr:T9SS type A sorting domain-containing protein [Candidatus Vicinibacter affinis]